MRSMSMQERMTLCNMSAELGAQTGLVAPDETTLAWLETAGVAREDISHWQTDGDASTIRHDFDASTLTPQVAAPHSPANTKSVGEFTDTKVQIAYIGACTGAKLEDLRAAAAMLRGKKVATGTRLMVAPASQQDLAAAQREGILQILQDAGAEMFATACGACAGYGGSVPEGSTVISSTARNFKGRMGAATAQVYLASPYTVAASALHGQITDPREVMA